MIVARLCGECLAAHAFDNDLDSTALGKQRRKKKKKKKSAFATYHLLYHICMSESDNLRVPLRGFEETLVSFALERP
jgi:hypothetical protein